jgi:hypothetical protein
MKYRGGAGTDSSRERENIRELSAKRSPLSAALAPSVTRRAKVRQLVALTSRVRHRGSNALLYPFEASMDKESDLE